VATATTRSRRSLYSKESAMIPTRLFLRNFMCYRDNVPPLDLKGIHLACLCGDNGNGKSALIDAITWALWGRSRAKSDDELINLGRREMEVELDFEVAGQGYRVSRKRSIPRSRSGGTGQRSGHTLLDLQIATNDSYRSIAGDSIAQTQQSIVDILRMDYSTFINSAFLRQGHADEFTVKPPGERKKVLADIMGLSLYDELEEKARTRAREKEQQQAALESAIHDMQHEISRRGEYEEQLQGIRLTLEGLDREADAQEKTVGQLRDARKALVFKQEQLSEVKATIDRAGRELERWRELARDHRQRIAEYRSIMDRREEVENGHARLQQLTAEVDDMDHKLQSSFALGKRKDHLARVIAEERGQLLEERGRMQSRVTDLEAQSARVGPLEKELAQARVRYDNVARLEEELDARKKESRDLDIRLETLRAGGASLKDEMEELKEKLHLISGAGARCPLCDSELGEEGRQSIERQYRQGLEAKAAACSKINAEIRERSRQHQENGRRIDRLQAQLDAERTSVQRQIASLENEVSQGREAGRGLPEARDLLQEVERRLSAGDYALAEQQELHEVDQQLESLGYDSERHRELRRLLDKFEPYRESRRKLDEADSQLPSEESRLRQAEEACSAWESTLDQAAATQAALEQELAGMPGLAAGLAEAERVHHSLRRRQSEARDAAVVIQEKLSRCAELEQKKTEKETSLARASRDRQVYEDLAQAFGKKGVQAFLIESAVPEIEEEANNLLGRMTDGAMYLTMDTQRETRKGEVVETLDIRISDDLGTRSYEMYSGGEAFRINLALRIALSKVLARRAGAPLPTLFIDEGFGTQDSDGLSKLVGAINSVQDDFRKILVITHLEELKDTFPVRIEVTKSGDGSMVSVS